MDLICYSCPANICARKMLFESKKNADVQLFAGENEKGILAHREILTGASVYFDRMFNGSFQEAEMSEVRIQKIETAILQSVIEFIYCQSIKELTVEMAIELVKSADLMALPKLTIHCEDYLRDNMPYKNCLEVYFLAKLLQNENLSKSSKKIIVTEFNAITQEDEFKNLEKKSFVDLLSEIHDFVCEDSIAEGVLAWVGFNQNRLIYFKEILKLMRIDLIERNDLIDKLFERCPGKEEYRVIVNGLKKRKCKTNVIKRQNRKIVAVVQSRPFNYSLLEYDFSTGLLSRTVKMPNYERVLGIWDHLVLYEYTIKLIVYNLDSNHTRTVNRDYGDNFLNFSCKIDHDMYLITKDNCFKLSLWNMKLKKLVHPKEYNDLEFEAMCRFNGELKIVANNVKKGSRSFQILTYKPLTNAWSTDPLYSYIEYKDCLNTGFLVPHKNCMYFFRNSSLYIYNLDNKLWSTIIPPKELRIGFLENIFSIGDKLIACYTKGACEYIVDQAEIRKLNIFKGHRNLCYVFEHLSG